MVRQSECVGGQSTECTFAFRWPGEECGMVASHKAILPNSL